MGKSGARGRGKGRGAGDRGRRSGGGGFNDMEDVSVPSSISGQNSRVGMLPPSDSDEEEDEEQEQPEEAQNSQQQAKGQSSKIGQLPSEDEDDEEDEEEDDDDGEEDNGSYLMAPREPRKSKEEALDPGQLQQDMQRLEIIRKRREDQRLKRIQEEGWDRFAPISETNKPPGHGESSRPPE